MSKIETIRAIERIKKEYDNFQTKNDNLIEYRDQLIHKINSTIDRIHMNMNKLYISKNHIDRKIEQHQNSILIELENMRTHLNSSSKMPGQSEFTGEDEFKESGKIPGHQEAVEIREIPGYQEAVEIRETPGYQESKESSELERSAYFVIYSHGELFQKDNNFDIKPTPVLITRKRISTCGAPSWVDRVEANELLNVLYEHIDELHLKRMMFSDVDKVNRYLKKSQYEYKADQNFNRSKSKHFFKKSTPEQGSKYNKFMEPKHNSLCDIHNICIAANAFREKLFSFKYDKNILEPEEKFGIFMLRDLQFIKKNGEEVIIHKGTNLLDNALFKVVLDRTTMYRTMEAVTLSTIITFFKNCKVQHIYYIDITCNVVMGSFNISDEDMIELLRRAKEQSQVAGFNKKNKSSKTKTKKTKKTRKINK